MLLRIEQNWKWEKKPSLILCVDETTHYGICPALGIGAKFGPKIMEARSGQN